MLVIHLDHPVVCPILAQYLEAVEDDLEETAPDFGRTKLVKMDIDTGDSPPISSRPYTLPLKHYEWVQREIESLEWAGVIKKSILTGQAQ